MAVERFSITAGWAAVIVAVAVPSLAGFWYIASSQAKAETTINQLDKRTEKVEANVYRIAVALRVQADPVTQAQPQPDPFWESTIANFTGRCVRQPIAFTAPRPLP